jgi:hypothetical protein
MKSLPITIGFGDLLRRIVVFEKVYPLVRVAAALGMTVRNFCAKLRNGTRFDPDDVAILLRVIDDERLRGWLFAGSGLLLVKHPVIKSDGSDMTLPRRTVACAMEAMSAICDLAHAVELSMLGRQQVATIEEHLDRAQSGLMSIKLHLAPYPADQGAGDDAGPREDFAHLVRRALMTDRGIRTRELALALNLSYSALQARMAARTGFAPAELRQLFRMFPEPRLADYLLTGTPYTAILRPAVLDLRMDYSPIRTGLVSMREVVTFLQALLSTEGRPDSSLRAALDRHLDEAVRQMAALRWTLTHIGRPDAPQTAGIPFRAQDPVAAAQGPVGMCPEPA